MSPKLLYACLKGLAISIFCCFLLLLAASGVLSAQKDPAPLIPICAYAILALGSALCGFLSVKFHPSRGLLCGALSGSIYAAVLLLVGLAIGMEHFVPAFLISLLCIVISAVFGYLALPKAPSAESIRRTALLRASAHAEKRISVRR